MLHSKIQKRVAADVGLGVSVDFYGALEKIRTSDLALRRRLLLKYLVFKVLLNNVLFSLSVCCSLIIADN